MLATGKKLALIGVVLGSLIAAAPGQATARWGGHGGWGYRGCCWSSCCYTSCCYIPCYTSYCCDPCSGWGYGGWGYGGWGGASVGCCASTASTVPAMGLAQLVTPSTSAETTASATLILNVPQDAVVRINGKQTTSTGSRREYVSHQLKDGQAYKYVVRAQVVREGKVVEDIQEVVLRGGQNKSLAMSLSGGAAQRLAAAR